MKEKKEGQNVGWEEWKRQEMQQGRENEVQKERRKRGRKYLGKGEKIGMKLNGKGKESKKEKGKKERNAARKERKRHESIKEKGK